MALVTVAEVKETLGVDTYYSDEYIQQRIDAAVDLLTAYCTAASIAAEPAPLKEAALNLAVNIFQNDSASGGQSVQMDLTGTPFKLGRSMLSSVLALITPYIDEGTLVG
jgi:hypothetical protein